MELILRVAADMEVSDLHLHAGHRVVTRIHGALAEQPTKEFSADKVERLVLAILTEAQQQQLQKAGELDFAYTIPSGARFRANTYRHQRGLDAVFRYVPAQPPTLEHLGLPASLAGMLRWHNGLMLFTGPAGCGKTSTMAAMVALLNKDRTDNIITIEDPIEFVHPPGRSSFIQREVGGHTRSFARALRGSLREDPDVIVVGELRDLETISLALSAAETGHLVLATLHTNNAVRTINRVINAYPPEQQDQARAMLSESLRGVISQRLLPRADGEGRALALEILVVNKAAANLIRENKTLQLRTLIQTASGEGMVLLDNALLQLVKAGTITREEALRHAEETRRFESA
ncbi:MAG: PilT/PilU family type 4a pilus ATPase [Deltaproteobacteria bacterium]|nr:PilT/PilU family type 4a pilus ATPase [Deltaproteobacteria bacterium]